MQENNGDSNNQNQKQSGLSWSTPLSSQAPAQKPATSPKVPASLKAPTSNASSAKYIGMIVVGVVAGIIIAWGWTALRSPASETATSTATGGNLGVNTNTVPALGSDPALTVMSPQPAGRSVAIAKAIVSSPTWIVVYDNKDGKPGNALGAALFFPEGQSGTVALLRSTMPGKTYLVAKQVDNGDRKFSLKDDQLLSEGGVVQWVSFETK